MGRKLVNSHKNGPLNKIGRTEYKYPAAKLLGKGKK